MSDYQSMRERVTAAHVHDNLGDEVSIVAAIFIVFVVTVTSLRIYCRLRFGTFRLGVDDILICIAAFFGVGFMLCTMLAATHGGVGRHIDTTTENENIFMRKLLYHSTAMYMLTMGLVKVSIIALYIRLSVSQKFRAVAFSLIIFIGLCTLANVIVALFPCNPVRKIWDITAKGKCVKFMDFMVVSAIINIVGDFAVFLLPVQMLWRVKLPKRQLISLYTLFGLGGFACIAGITRLLSIVHMRQHYGDQTWTIVSPLISSIVEIGIAILVASGPALKALMRQNSTQPLGTSSSSFVELNPERMRRMQDPYYDEECAYPPYPPTPPPSPANNMPAEFQKEVEISSKELMMIVVDADGRVHICR